GLSHPAGRGLRSGRGAERRVRRLSGERRDQPSLPLQDPRAELSVPAGHGLDVPRAHAGRRLGRPGLAGYRVRGDRPLSVRRLAQVQPASFAFKPATLKRAREAITHFPVGRQQSAVIQVLWLVQKQEGWVSEPAIRAVAELLGMPVIRVLEVATFYTMFMLEPVGEVALVQVCGTTPCQTRGSEALLGVCQRKFGPSNHRSPDGKFYWQEVECMGACANAPMAAINDYYYED